MITYFDNENSLVDTLSHIESFDVIINNRKKTYQPNDVEFVDILKKISNIFQNSCLLPALGVALNEEVLTEIKKGEWIEINFEKETIKNDLVFKSLLFKLEETSGINLIRFNDSYEGRCLYLMLNEQKNLNDLVESINKEH